MNEASIVVYDSYSGNTRQVAESLAQGLGCEAVNVRDFKSENAAAYGLIVVGSPINSGKATKRIKGFIRSIPAGSRYALFCTYGAPVWGPISARMAFYFLKHKAAGQLAGTFRCRGYHNIFKTYAGHPDAGELKAAREFGESLKNV